MFYNNKKKQFSFHPFTSLSHSLWVILFPNKPCFFTGLHYKSFENLVGKGEIARYEQFLIFPQCFLPVWRTCCHFHQSWNCSLLTLSVWKSLKLSSGKGLCRKRANRELKTFCQTTNFRSFHNERVCRRQIESFKKYWKALQKGWGALRGSVVKCLTRNPGDFLGSVPGQEGSEPQTKPIVQVQFKVYKRNECFLPIEKRQMFAMWSCFDKNISMDECQMLS